jgi:orotate phosphoribosyltransferase-like protein
MAIRKQLLQTARQLRSEGMTQRAIAAELGISLGQVNKLLTRSASWVRAMDRPASV